MTRSAPAALVRTRLHRRQRAGEGPPEASAAGRSFRSYVSREASPEERQATLAQSLLDRCGIVVREAVHAEGARSGQRSIRSPRHGGGGRVRRGYFVEARSSPVRSGGAVDRLRALREPGETPRTLLLAHRSANPYGGRFPAEAVAGRKPPHAGAVVVSVDCVTGRMGRLAMSDNCSPSWTR